MSSNNNNINSQHNAPHIKPPLSSSQSLFRTYKQRDNPPEEPTNTYSPSCCYNTFNINPPFDSAMALTVLVLLTALFFMGFFSIYIRRFADEDNVHPTRRRTRNSAVPAAAGYFATGKGVDPAVVGSLPVYEYSGGDVDVEKGVILADMECAICLSELEEREWVKVIPYCGHVFHVECIDRWLSSHVTCPLCRTAELFPETEKGEVHVAGGEEERGGGWRDRCGRVRRSSSCCWYGERVRLHRSLSF